MCAENWLYVLDLLLYCTVLFKVLHRASLGIIIAYRFLPLLPSFSFYTCAVEKLLQALGT